MNRALCVLAVATAMLPALAQDPTTGLPPFGSFSASALDTVNRENLNVNVRFPIVSSPGRAGTALSHAIVHDSLVWRRNSGNTAWVPVSNQSGIPIWGWKTDQVVGTSKYSVTSEWCEDVWAKYYSGYTYTDPQGTLHTFSSVGFYKYISFNCTLPLDGPKIGYADDASGYKLDATVAASPVVYDPEGNKVTTSGTSPDRNGNFISYTIVSSTETHWTDQAGRVALKIVKNTDNTQFKTLASDGSYVTRTLAYQTFAVKTNFQCSGVAEYTNAAVKLPTSLTLPNGQSFGFSYEETPGSPGYVTGRLKRVTLPTGGYYEYTYPGPNGGMDCSTGRKHMQLERTVSTGTATSVWKYVREPFGSGWRTTETAPRVSYQAAANEAQYDFEYGAVTAERYYEGPASGGVELLTRAHVYAANGTPESVETTLKDVTPHRVSKAETTYDDRGTLLEVREYETGDGTPGSMFRKTTWTYVTDPAYAARNLIRLPASQIVRDMREGGAEGVIKSRTEITYDDTAHYTCDNAATSAVQHNHSSYGCSFYVRGNVTGIVRYKEPAAPAAPVMQTNIYDQLGNLVRMHANGAQQREWQFSVSTQWSQPDAETWGPPGGPQLVSSVTYNAHTGLVQTATDPNGGVTTITRADPLLRVTLVQRADGSVATTTYDDGARTQRSVFPIAGVEQLRLTEVRDTLGRTVRNVMADRTDTVDQIREWQYDELSRPHRACNPIRSEGDTRYWTETRFDALGRPVLRIPADGSATSNRWSWSYAGSEVVATDPTGRKQRFVYGAAGSLSEVREPAPSDPEDLSVSTTYAYDVFSNLVEVTQGVQTRSFTYDALGRLIEESTPEAGATIFEYDDFGNPTRRVDARGVESTYEYDALHRLEHVAFDVTGTSARPTPELSVVYGTDAQSHNNGRVVSVAAGGNTESYQYDLLGGVTGVVKTIRGQQYTIGASYDLAGGITSLSYPSGRTVTIARDSLGRAASIASGGTVYAQSFDYAPSGALSSWTLGNGIVATRTYSPERMTLATLAYTRGGQPILQLGFDYAQPTGTGTQIIGVADVVAPGRSLTYSYDALGRLSSASSQGSAEYPQWSLAWSYDRYGNRLTQTCSSGNCGALTQALGVDAATNRLSDLGFAYDAAGNLTAFPGTSMAYNATGRLVESATSGALATYEYDAAMTRVAQTVGSTTTVTVTGFGFTMAEYDDGVLARENIQLGGMLIARHEGGTLTYFLHDHLSVRLLTDEAGAIKPSGEQGHYPFGESWYDATPADPEFTSYSRDEESGLDDAVFRQYSSEFGRFTMPDPIAGQIGQPQSWNRYAYVWNDPVNLVDPLGLFPVDNPQSCPVEALWVCFDNNRCYWECPYHHADVEVSARGGDILLVWKVADYWWDLPADLSHLGRGGPGLAPWAPLPKVPVCRGSDARLAGVCCGGTTLSIGVAPIGPTGENAEVLKYVVVLANTIRGELGPDPMRRLVMPGRIVQVAAVAYPGEGSHLLPGNIFLSPLAQSLSTYYPVGTWSVGDSGSTSHGVIWNWALQIQGESSRSFQIWLNSEVPLDGCSGSD